MPTKADVMRDAQRNANCDGHVRAVVNLNPFASLWVCRNVRSYDSRTDLNQPDKLFIRPALAGLYILYKNGKRAMNIAGKVPVYLDGMHAQVARDAMEHNFPNDRAKFTYQPVEMHELADCEWYYVNA